jgi:hypothetical protein
MPSSTSLINFIHIINLLKKIKIKWVIEDMLIVYIGKIEGTWRTKGCAIGLDIGFLYDQLIIVKYGSSRQ